MAVILLASMSPDDVKKAVQQYLECGGYKVHNIGFIVEYGDGEAYFGGATAKIECAKEASK